MDDFAHIVGEDVHFRGRSPSGERGLKCPPWARSAYGDTGRSPSGERGLKFLSGERLNDGSLSLPIRGAWIEISPVRRVRAVASVAPHPGSVD